MNLIEQFPILVIGLSFMPITYFLGRISMFWLKMDSFEWRGLIFQAMGYGILSYLIVVFGLVGALNSKILWNLYWVLLGLSALTIFEWWGWIFTILRSCRGENKFSDRLLLFLGFLYFLLLLVAVVSPEIGTDSLCYHLGTPKTFLEMGRLSYLPYDVNSVFPFFVQMLYLFALALKGVLLVKFFHFEMGLLLFISLFLLLKDEKVRKPFFWAFLLILTPGITNQIAMAFTDVALAAYTFLGVIFFLKGLEEERLGLYCVGGIFFGFALSIKVIAAVNIIPLVIVGLLVVLFQRSFRGVLRFGSGTSMFLIALLLASSFWFMRAYVTTGNPVFPYFNRVFQIEGLPGDYAVKGMGTSLMSFVLLPWNLVSQAVSFGHRGDQIGPVFLLLLPFVIWGVLSNRLARRMAGVGLGAVVFWFILAQRSRFMYPILPLFMTAGACGLEDLGKRFPRIGGFLRALFWIPFIFLLAIAFYHYRYHLNLATGKWTNTEFRENLERSFVITEYVNQNLPATGVKILNTGENHRFYFDRTMVRGELFALKTHYAEALKTPEEVVNFLKAQGFTHILWASPVGKTEQRPALAIGTLVRDKTVGPQYFELVYQARSKNQRDQLFDYALYRIR